MVDNLLISISALAGLLVVRIRLYEQDGVCWVECSVASVVVANTVNLLRSNRERSPVCHL